jgi:hypothetical protein
MQSKAKSNSVCTAVYSQGEQTLTIKVLGAGTAVCKLGNISIENRHEAMVRGMSQRLTNMAALGRDKATGHSATPAEKFARVKLAVDHYNSGTKAWRVAGEDGFDAGLVIQAMIRAEVASDADVANAIANKLAAKRGIDRVEALRQWALVGSVAEKMVEIETERAMVQAKKANLDAQALLDEIDAEDDEDDGAPEDQSETDAPK